MAVATMRPEAQPQYPAIKPGMMGMFIIHPAAPDEDPVDRDFAWMTHASNPVLVISTWAIR